MNTDNKQSVFIPIPAKPESVFIRVACDLSTGQDFVMRLFTRLPCANSPYALISMGVPVGTTDHSSSIS